MDLILRHFETNLNESEVKRAVPKRFQTFLDDFEDVSDEEAIVDEEEQATLSPAIGAHLSSAPATRTLPAEHSQASPPEVIVASPALAIQASPADGNVATPAPTNRVSSAGSIVPSSAPANQASTAGAIVPSSAELNGASGPTRPARKQSQERDC